MMLFEYLARSPIFTQLSSTLVGLTTLRAHKCERFFQQTFDRFQNVHTSSWFLYLATTRWFGLWLDWICVLYAASVTFICVALRESI